MRLLRYARKDLKDGHCEVVYHRHREETIGQHGRHLDCRAALAKTGEPSL